MQIFCPSCQRQLRVPDQAVGKTVRCPACKTTFAVGSASSAEQIQAPVAPRPTTPEPAPRNELAPPGRPRWDSDDVDDGAVVLRGDEQAQRLTRGTVIWFFCAAAFTL